jgi:hypothetical protein
LGNMNLRDINITSKYPVTWMCPRIRQDYSPRVSLHAFSQFFFSKPVRFISLTVQLSNWRNISPSTRNNATRKMGPTDYFLDDSQYHGRKIYGHHMEVDARHIVEWSNAEWYDSVRWF